MGRKMQKTKLLTTVTALSLSCGAASAAEVVDYTYDALGRLVKVERSGSVNNNIDTEYEYDKADNRTREKTTGSQPPS